MKLSCECVEEIDRARVGRRRRRMKFSFVYAIYLSFIFYKNIKSLVRGVDRLNGLLGRVNHIIHADTVNC